MELRDGETITCKIDGREIKDARLRFENGRWYICQNIIAGSSCINKLGYEYSWVCGKAFENFRGSGVTDLKYNIYVEL